MEFLWYDYETTGRSASADRIVQFAGIRTDENFNQIGAELSWFCRPTLDCLPEVGACRVHGVTPQYAERHGLPEYELAAKIHSELSRPGTCSVGYNASNFDHRFTQFLFYRNLLQPYFWGYKRGNSKWDVIDLMRAAFVLRPEGIEWPRKKSGKPAFSLQALAEANSLRVGLAHEALSDVRATIAMSKLVKDNNPKLFAHGVSLRRKRTVKEILEKETFIYISGAVVARRQTGTIATCLHTDNTDKNLLYDLSFDPTNYLGESDEEIKAKVKKYRTPFYGVRSNAPPFLVAYKVREHPTEAEQETLNRLSLDPKLVLENYHQLLTHKDFFIQRVAKLQPVSFGGGDKPSEDVDQALYGKLPDVGDYRKLPKVVREVIASEGRSGMSGLEFKDDRIPQLLFRFRARYFPDSLSEEEHDRWHAHCRQKIFEKGSSKGRSMYERFLREIQNERSKNEGGLFAQYLDDLEAYGIQLKKVLQG